MGQGVYMDEQPPAARLAMAVEFFDAASEALNSPNDRMRGTALGTLRLILVGEAVFKDGAVELTAKGREGH